MTLATLKEKIKIIFFDIDDTLFLKNKNYVPESILPALKQLKNNGIILAIATGRTKCAFPEQINQLIQEVGIEVLVTMNGQYNLYQNQVIKEYPIPQEKIAELVQFFGQHQIDYSFVTPEKVTVSAKTDYVAEALDPITKNYEIDCTYFKQHSIQQMLAYYGEEQDEFIRQSNILGQSLKTVRWHENSVDIFAAEGSKARGIQHILQHLNLSPEQALVFGDGLNDIEMFEFVGTSVAMGNASEKLKKLATFTTDDVENHGIANFLVKAGLIKANCSASL